MPAPLQRQRGAALIVALIILVMLTLLAITASRFTLLGTRSSLNFQLKNTAFQAAETGLARGLATIESGAADLALDSQNVPQPSITETLEIAAGHFVSQVEYTLVREESIIDNGSSVGEGIGLPKIYRYLIESHAQLADQPAHSILEQGYNALHISD